MTTAQYILEELGKDRLRERLRVLENDLKDSSDPELLARYPHLGKDRLRERLRVLENDLKDSSDPELLARYPHLGAESLRMEIQDHIDEMKHQLAGEPEQPCDKVVDAVRADLLRRSQLGIQKYGVTLERTDLSLEKWLQHAYEECLDQANYLKRAILEIEQYEQE